MVRGTVWSPTAADPVQQTDLPKGVVTPTCTSRRPKVRRPLSLGRLVLVDAVSTPDLVLLSLPGEQVFHKSYSVAVVLS